MPKKINKAVLKSFIQRRKINALGLTIITAASAIITMLCAFTGFARTDILVIVTILLVALCLLQLIRNRKGFRTIRAAKGLRRKKNRSSESNQA